MQNPSNSTPPSPTSSLTNAVPDSKSAVAPLAEASAASLEELMNRAPNLSDAEVDVIVNYLRAQREKFAQQEAAPKPKKAPRKKGPIISADELLADLD